MPEIVQPRITMERIMNPRSVAVFGASDDRQKWAGRIMYYLAMHGFGGEVVPINPRREIVQGKKCYPRIGEAPPVDVAVIAIPAGSVLATLEECAAAGVGCCLIITSGFAEVGEQGTEMQQALTDLSRRTGMRLIGPNCLGFINVLNGMALTSARVLEVEKLYRGDIGLVTQSGAIMLSIFNRAHDVGIGFSQCISVGNQADLEVSDFVEQMIEDAATKVICLHVEGIRDAARFLRLAHRAREAGKPLVVVKTGRSELGEKAAQSHTASLAGAYPVFEAAARDAGVILTDDPDGMVLIASMISRFGTLGAGGLGIVSSSGGINGIIADRLGEIGFPIASFAPETKAALSELMLPTHLENPMDLGARRQELGEGVVIAERVVQAVARDPGVNFVLIMLTTTPHYEATARALCEAAARSGKPNLTVLTPGSVAEGVRSMLREIGAPFCDRIDDGIRMLQAHRAYSQAIAEPRAPLPALCQDRPVRARWMPELGTGYLTEPRAKALLAGYGIPITLEQVVTSRDAAIEAAGRIGYPVVMKGVSATIVHKSDAGLVKLGLGDAAAVGAAWDDIAGKLATLTPAEPVEAVVQTMVAGQVELFVGAKHDPQFGPVVLVGAGGVLVELLQDVQMALAPIDIAAAERLLRRLRVWPLLAGYRNRPALDIAAVAKAISDVSRLADEAGSRLVELDINPLMVGVRGVVAADARAVLTDSAAH